MKFKLDENFGTRTFRMFQQAGHDVQTVRQQQLQGKSDSHLFAACCAEQRCLVTLDLDFGDIVRFDPSVCGGIAVIRLPHNPSLELLESMIQQFLRVLEGMSVERSLWIIEPRRIRVHQQEQRKEHDNG